MKTSKAEIVVLDVPLLFQSDFPFKCDLTVSVIADREERLWIDAVRNDTDPLTLPEQAYCITRILEGIYESAKTGKPYYFN